MRAFLLLLISAWCGGISTGCALITHDMGVVRQQLPEGGAVPAQAVTEDVGARMRKENREVKRFLDPVDDLHRRVALTKVDDAEVCVAMLHYELPTKNRFETDAHPLQAHRLYLVRSDGLTLERPRLQNLTSGARHIRYVVEGEVVVGHDRVRSADGRHVATVERTRYGDVTKKIKLLRYEGEACFPTRGAFLAAGTRWVKFSLRAKLYARDYTFEFQ